MTARETAGSGPAPGAVSFDANGLIPVVAQDEATGDVLLLAYMNEEALRRTLAEQVLVLWSRSRATLWRKGEQSGHRLQVREVRVNCEGNSLLARVQLEGPGACHEGYRTCYFRRLDEGAAGEYRATVVEQRAFDPHAVYGDVAAQTLPRGATEHERETFERDMRELYAAYERLRDGEEIAESRTSRLLHERDREAASRRALRRGMDELGELRGVNAGTHRHRGGEADVILEASQVGYWALVAAIAQGAAYGDWMPHALWLSRWDAPDVTVAGHENSVLQECAELVLAAAEQCRVAGVHPARVIAADLAAMRAKHPHQGASDR